MQRELLRERTRCKALEEELENPMNIHRWRKLEVCAFCEISGLTTTSGITTISILLVHGKATLCKLGTALIIRMVLHEQMHIS